MSMNICGYSNIGEIPFRQTPTNLSYKIVHRGEGKLTDLSLCKKRLQYYFEWVGPDPGHVSTINEHLNSGKVVIWVC